MYIYLLSYEQQVILGTEKLQSLQQWLEMSEVEREDFLVSIKNMVLICELEYMGAFSEAQSVPFDYDSIRCLYLFLHRIDVDDMSRFNGRWFNDSKGIRQRNSSDTLAHRAKMTKQQLMALFVSQCLRDPDPELKDELASLVNITAKAQFSIHKDHYGKKNREPSALSDEGIVFMLNECASSLAPMKDITHEIRTKNQNAYARENGIDPNGDEVCMIARDFSKHMDKYSDERRAQLTAYKTT